MISGVLAARRVGRGETVGLRFEPFGCMIFPHHSMAPSDESPAVAEVRRSDHQGATDPMTKRSVGSNT
jgi:hypothetical protein